MIYWIYEGSPLLIDPDNNGKVYKLWWVREDGSQAYAESLKKEGPWTELELEKDCPPTPENYDC